MVGMVNFAIDTIKNVYEILGEPYVFGQIGFDGTVMCNGW